jgi:hypothetical protein
MARSPYADYPSHTFWRTGVAEITTAVDTELYNRKWEITRDMKIATAGSCFAQHIGRHLRAGGFSILDVEPAPQHLPEDRHLHFGYGIYSGRYGNVYTMRQMLQLAREALGETPRRDFLWEKDGRWYDGLRPTIEPDGLSSPAAVTYHRDWHLGRVRKLLTSMDMLIFTLGLTEAWIDKETGTVFPVCPGTVTDNFDPQKHVFHNFTYPEIHADFLELKALLEDHRPKHKPRLKFLLTVSPVPLTATAAGRHVQVATVYSKSVLRAVSGDLSDAFPEIDYFPSYEIITSPWSGRDFYAGNKRSVTAEGVGTAMHLFMTSHGGEAMDATPVKQKPRAAPTESFEEDPDMLVVCDEELLDAFGGSRDS